MADANRKDSTNELPMHDLGEIIKMVETIHDKALETAPMPDVAKGCGYANPTSTPFYRRMVAARLFRLLNSTKAELSNIALDYIKPDAPDARQNALTQAIMGIKIYSDIVNQHLGKKINLELITNRLEKDSTLAITRACAKICAYTFDSSLKFAGFIALDGTVTLPTVATNATKSTAEAEPVNANKGKEYEFILDDDSQIQTLYLDKSRKRKVTVQSPFAVSKDELERIRSWLGVVLIIQGITVTDETQQ